MPNFATDPGTVKAPMDGAAMAEGLKCGVVTVDTLNWIFNQLFAGQQSFVDGDGDPIPDGAMLTTALDLADAIAAIPAEKYLQGLSGYNAATNVLTLLMNDGSTVNVDLTALIADATPVPWVISAAIPAGAPAGGASLFHLYIGATPPVLYYWSGGAWIGVGEPHATAAVVAAGTSSSTVIDPIALKGALQSPLLNYPVDIGSGAGKDSVFNGISIGKGAAALSRNLKVGQGGMGLITTANQCTGVGYLSLQSITTGTGNTGVGDTCLRYVAAGTNNTAIGMGAYNVNGNDFSNATALGAGAQPASSNVVQLGNAATTPNAYAALVIVSDARDKTDIAPADADAHKLLDLLEVTKYRMDPRDAYIEAVEVANPFYRDAPAEGDDNRRDFEIDRFIPETIEVEPDGSKARRRVHIGLIAQQVKKAADTLGVDFAGFKDASFSDGRDRLHLDYTAFVPLLIQKAQAMEKKITALEAKLYGESV